MKKYVICHKKTWVLSKKSIKGMMLWGFIITFATNHRHIPQRRCWCDIVELITSVCCYSELLQEPEKFKKAQTEE